MIKTLWKALNGDVRAAVVSILYGVSIVSAAAFFMPILIFCAKEWWKFWL